MGEHPNIPAYIDAQGRSTEHAKKVAERFDWKNTNTKDAFAKDRDRLREIVSQNQLPKREDLNWGSQEKPYIAREGDAVLKVLRKYLKNSKLNDDDFVHLSYGHMFRQVAGANASAQEREWEVKDNDGKVTAKHKKIFNIDYLKAGDQLWVKNGVLHITRKNQKEHGSFMVPIYPWQEGHIYHDGADTGTNLTEAGKVTDYAKPETREIDGLLARETLERLETELKKDPLLQDLRFHHSQSADKSIRNLNIYLQEGEMYYIDIENTETPKRGYYISIVENGRESKNEDNLSETDLAAKVKEFYIEYWDKKVRDTLQSNSPNITRGVEIENQLEWYEEANFENSKFSITKQSGSNELFNLWKLPYKSDDDAFAWYVPLHKLSAKIQKLKTTYSSGAATQEAAPAEPAPGSTPESANETNSAFWVQEIANKLPGNYSVKDISYLAYKTIDPTVADVQAVRVEIKRDGAVIGYLEKDKSSEDDFLIIDANHQLITEIKKVGRKEENFAIKIDIHSQTQLLVNELNKLKSKTEGILLKTLKGTNLSYTYEDNEWVTLYLGSKETPLVTIIYDDESKEWGTEDGHDKYAYWPEEKLEDAIIKYSNLYYEQAYINKVLTYYDPEKFTPEEGYERNPFYVEDGRIKFSTNFWRNLPLDEMYEDLIWDPPFKETANNVNRVTQKLNDGYSKTPEPPPPSTSETLRGREIEDNRALITKTLEGTGIIYRIEEGKLIPSHPERTESFLPILYDSDTDSYKVGETGSFETRDLKEAIKVAANDQYYKHYLNEALEYYSTFDPDPDHAEAPFYVEDGEIKFHFQGINVHIPPLENKLKWEPLFDHIQWRNMEKGPIASALNSRYFLMNIPSKVKAIVKWHPLLKDAEIKIEGKSNGWETIMISLNPTENAVLEISPNSSGHYYSLTCPVKTFDNLREATSEYLATTIESFYWDYWTEKLRTEVDSNLKIGDLAQIWLQGGDTKHWSARNSNGASYGIQKQPGSNDLFTLMPGIADQSGETTYMTKHYQKDIHLRELKARIEALQPLGIVAPAPLTPPPVTPEAPARKDKGEGREGAPVE